MIWPWVWRKAECVTPEAGGFSTQRIVDREQKSRLVAFSCLTSARNSRVRSARLLACLAVLWRALQLACNIRCARDALVRRRFGVPANAKYQAWDWPRPLSTCLRLWPCTANVERSEPRSTLLIKCRDDGTGPGLTQCQSLTRNGKPSPCHRPA
jgi:hypothetical protein